MKQKTIQTQAVLTLLLDANLKNLYSEAATQRLWYRCFPVNFVKFLRTPFLIEHRRWLLLFIDDVIPLHNFGF